MNRPLLPSGIISCYSVPQHSAPATQDPLVCLRSAKNIPASGPLFVLAVLFYWVTLQTITSRSFISFMSSLKCSSQWCYQSPLNLKSHAHIHTFLIFHILFFLFTYFWFCPPVLNINYIRTVFIWLWVLSYVPST